MSFAIEKMIFHQYAFYYIDKIVELKTIKNTRSPGNFNILIGRFISIFVDIANNVNYSFDTKIFSLIIINESGAKFES